MKALAEVIQGLDIREISVYELHNPSNLLVFGVGPGLFRLEIDDIHENEVEAHFKRREDHALGNIEKMHIQMEDFLAYVRVSDKIKILLMAQTFSEHIG